MSSKLILNCKEKYEYHRHSQFMWSKSDNINRTKTVTGYYLFSELGRYVITIGSWQHKTLITLSTLNFCLLWHFKLNVIFSPFSSSTSFRSNIGMHFAEEEKTFSSSQFHQHFMNSFSTILPKIIAICGKYGLLRYCHF